MSPETSQPPVILSQIASTRRTRHDPAINNELHVHLQSRGLILAVHSTRVSFETPLKGEIDRPEIWDRLSPRWRRTVVVEPCL